MRLSTEPSTVLAALLFPFLTTAVGNIDCHHVRVDRTDFDLSLLGGPRSTLHSVDQGVSLKNSTYTIDICKPLVRAKDVPTEYQCPGGTRVCGIERLLNKQEESDTIERVIPIAGELKEKGGGHMDAKWELLSKSTSHSDSEKEGLRVEMNGGFIGTGKDKRAQKAIIEFICDRSRTGLENLWQPEDKYDDSEESEYYRRAAEDGDEENDGEGAGEGGDEDSDLNSSSLQFVRYDVGSGDADVLRLKWLTKYACEGSKAEQDGENTHWGFFTWFIIIAFLSTAAYLIFGSWLNYNRYGARGWDLVPHGDQIRDVPYLLKDWTRGVLNTAQNGGRRGGYAAV